MLTIKLPMNQGWTVEWETGKTWTDKRGRVHVLKDSYETTDYQKAMDKKSALEKFGFKNVQIYECLF